MSAQELLELRKYYKSTLDEAMKSLEKAPQEGRLRVSKCGGSKQYFKCIVHGDTKGTYIKKKDIKEARAMAQRDYDRKIVACAKSWINWIDRTLAGTPDQNMVDIYHKSLHRIELINPYEIPEDLYIRQWQDAPYETNPYPFGEAEFYSDLGERVRSKSELLIANMLLSKGIPYKYEKSMILKNGQIVYPDFTLLDVQNCREIILEHFGMMGDFNYADNAYNKILLYEKNGYWPGDNFLFTMETGRQPVDTKLLREMIDRSIVV